MLTKCIQTFTDGIIICDHYSFHKYAYKQVFTLDQSESGLLAYAEMVDLVQQASNFRCTQTGTVTL